MKFRLPAVNVNGAVRSQRPAYNTNTRYKVGANRIVYIYMRNAEKATLGEIRGGRHRLSQSGFNGSWPSRVDVKYTVKGSDIPSSRRNTVLSHEMCFIRILIKTSNNPHFAQAQVSQYGGTSFVSCFRIINPCWIFSVSLVRFYIFNFPRATTKRPRVVDFASRDPLMTKTNAYGKSDKTNQKRWTSGDLVSSTPSCLNQMSFLHITKRVSN